MAATSAQIEAALDLTGTYSLITGAAVITDNSDWGSIAIATPDTAKILLLIYDSAGNEFYRNSGWDAGVYTSPDLSLTDTTYDFTLPTDIAADYLQGQYTIYAKVQVVEGGETTVVQKTFYQLICPCCNDITIDVQGSVVAGTTEVNLTDQTNYKTYTDLSRTMILYPPPPSGQANQTGTDVDVIVYSGTVYTGVWTWKITSDVTFTDAATGAATTCRLTGQGTFNVEQSQLCKVLCLVEKYRNQTLLPTISRKNGTVLLQNYFLAMTEFQLARDGYICGKSQTVIDAHIQKVYDLLGIDPDCDCGCDDGVSQPLLSVTSVDGTDGTDGSVIYSGSGAPSSGTGVVGDYYVRSDTGGWYKKTGATTWTLQFTIAGAAGAAGANGVAVLWNDISDSSTAGTSLEILKTYSMPADTLATDESYVEVEGVFTCSSVGELASQICALYFNGSSLNASGQDAQNIFNANLSKITIKARLTRVSNTALKVMVTTKTEINATGAVFTVSAEYEAGYYDVAGLNLTTTGYDITARADSDVIGDITCESLTVTLYAK